MIHDNSRFPIELNTEHIPGEEGSQHLENRIAVRTTLIRKTTRTRFSRSQKKKKSQQVNL